jgi:putative transposase
VTWAVREKGYSQRHACRLVGLHPKTYRYVTKRSDDEDLRRRLRELASQRRRFGYRRLGLMLERQGVKLSPKKLYRLYKEAVVASELSVPGRRWLSLRIAIFAGRSTSWLTRW